MGGLGDHIHRRRSLGLGEYLEPRQSGQAGGRPRANGASWYEQLAWKLADASGAPLYPPSKPLMRRGSNGWLPAFEDYISNSAQAVGRMPRDLAGMLADLRADPLDFLSKAGPGLAGLGMAIPVVGGGAAAAGEGASAGRAFNYTQTVLGHVPTRPYVNSTLLTQEIMSTGRGIRDPGGIVGALRYDVPGKVGKTNGIYELVVSPKERIVWHYLHNPKK